MKKDALREAAEQRILVLDGAMGTMIQEHDFSEEDYRGKRFADYEHSLKGNNDLLTLTQPDAIRTIHEKYLLAGADITETNTFSGTRIAMSDYHMEDLVPELNYESAILARQAADKITEQQPDKPRFVAGSMGPTNKTASLSPDVNNPGFRAIDFDTLKENYQEQARHLIRGGVDLLLVETVFDTLNAKAALFALEELFEELGKEVPIMASGTITDASGRTLSGQTPEAFWTSLSHINLFSIGLNCALGADQLRPHLQAISREAPIFTSAHPNAGLPNAFGEYEQTPEEMGEQIKEYLDLNLVNVIGGCCGTTPEHIKVIADLAAQYQPRQVEKATSEA